MGWIFYYILCTFLRNFFFILKILNEFLSDAENVSSLKSDKNWGLVKIYLPYCHICIQINIPVYNGPSSDGPLSVRALWCTILVHFFRISLWQFIFFHVALFSYSIIHTFLCKNLFMVHFFSMLHSFCVLHNFMLHFHTLQFFRFVFFSFFTFCMLQFFPVTLFPCCTFSISRGMTKTPTNI